MVVITYLIKMSVGIAAVYALYQTLFSSLTFFNWRRYYLLAGALLACLLPLVSWPVIQTATRTEIPGFTSIPLLQENITGYPEQYTGISFSLLLLVCIGVGIFVRALILIIRYASLVKLRRKSVLADTIGNARIYMLPQTMSPFSFGRSIFISAVSPDPSEIQQIIAHEYAHVRQMHTIDLLISEIICTINWFNPFAWWLRRSIKENLEFAADHAVLEQGFAIKPYQYLLLQLTNPAAPVLGHYFNISSLKKRIVMINHPRSSSLQRARFLWSVPVLAVLITFCSNNSTRADIASSTDGSIITDTVLANSAAGNGFILSVADNQGEEVVIVKNARSEIVRAIALADWERDRAKWEKQYGRLPEQRADKATMPKITQKLGSDKTHLPLFLVDGVVQSNTFVNSLDPESIASIDILKDKAAAEIYGERGKNGVVVIRMKSK